MCERFWKEELRRVALILKDLDLEDLNNLPVVAEVYDILHRLVLMGCKDAGPYWMGFDEYLDAACKYLVALEARGEITFKDGFATSTVRLAS